MKGKAKARGNALDEVGTVIVNWNTAEALLSCVDSFLSQGVRCDHLAVVDQGSTDGSADRLRRTHPNVRLIILQENNGYSHAVNAGLKNLDVPFAVVANADIKLREYAIERLFRAMQADPSIALAGPRVLDPAGNHVTRFSRTGAARSVLLEIIPRRFRGMWRDAEHMRYRSDRSFDISYVEGACMLVRRDSLNRIGGLDEGFSFFFEDADLPIRLKKSGFRVVHVPSAEVVHAGSSSFMQVPLRHAAEFYRNIVRFYERHALRRAIWLKTGVAVVCRTKGVALRALLAIPFLRNAERLAFRIRRARGIVDAMKVPGRVLAQENSISDPAPFVSVIIPTRNRPGCVIRLIDALKEQDYRQFEIIVVDQSDCVEPHVANVYRELRDRVVPIFVKGVGRSNAKNIGIAAAKGSLLLFCDDDILPGKEFVRVHVESHKDPSVGGVSCRTLEEGLPEIRTKRICQVRWYGKMIAGFQSETTCFVHTLVGGNMSIKREIQREVGYFDPLFNGTSIYEEQDFSDRLRRLGYRVLFTSAASIVHYPQADGNVGQKAAQPASYYRSFHHNEIVYFLKNRSRWCLPFVVPFCLLRTIKQALAYKMSFRDALHVFGGVLDGFSSYYRTMR